MKYVRANKLTDLKPFFGPQHIFNFLACALIAATKHFLDNYKVYLDTDSTYLLEPKTASIDLK